MKILILLALLFAGQNIITGRYRKAAGSLGVLSAWRMNEGSGTTLTDVGPDGYNVTLVAGAVTWQSNTGLPGTTTFWNAGGGGDTGGVVANLNFSGATPFSVALWVNPGAGSGHWAWIGNLTPPTSFVGWEIGTDVVTKITFYVVATTGSNAIAVNGNTALTANAANYVVATYDGSKNASGVKLYLNGTLQTNTVTQNTFTSSSTSTRAVTFGCRPFNCSNKFTGAMAFAEIWNRVISASEVTAFNAAGPKIN